ncbi:MAG: trypsin-like peptidase domain-containing protein [Rhodospirillales bacterium]|nr:trypsin-like peptidase domain-containing protein [Alphaproteobacteria bacterium]USO04093.1 MAG: trypsin-like peptidase domain-containing protein [Rhodospirillales bacterium]
MRFFLFLAFVSALSAAACQRVSVAKHPLQPYPDIPENVQPAPIGFNKLRFHIPTGSHIASTGPKGPLGIFLCGTPYDTMQKGIIGRYFVDDNLKEIFGDTLEAQGYDVTGDPGLLFDEDADRQRTVYSIGARVTDMRMDLCDRKSFLTGADRGYTGEGELEIEWSVFDLLHRRSVYKNTTHGYAQLSVANHEGMQLIIDDAFAAAVHNLGADPEFRALVLYGDLPDKEPNADKDPGEEPTGLFDPQETVTLRNPPLFKKPAAGRLENLLKTAVQIEAGGTMGSGFFITDKGHILTNAHVVGNAFRVRIVSSGKKEKMIAEVLRTDRLRDVALLRLEKVPEHLNITTLPIRMENPKVGEDIYAIGSPQYRQLQDTVTKGIVSSLRYDRREHQPYIQGDVTIHGGNSGGPLLDANGNIIGISVSGYIDREGKDLSGLNNFIPIGQALEKLGITLD